MAFIYTHHKADTNEIFYVGIGKGKDGTFKRAYDKNKRSKFWKYLVSKHGFTVQIVASDIDWDSALKLEKQLIAKHGRSNNETGVLCNLTDGGEGCFGFVVTDEYREKLSKAIKGRPGKSGIENSFYGKTHTLETRAKMSASQIAGGKNKGVNNNNYGKKMSNERRKQMSEQRKGKKLSAEHKKKISEGGKGIPKSKEWREKVSGANNFWYGKGHLMSGSLNANAKSYIFIETGEIFKGLAEACEAKGLNYHTQRAYLSPHHVRHNRRKFNYI
jgi:hypothetical protein